MLATKTVKQSYSSTPSTLRLLDDFRRMINDCIRIGLEREKDNPVTSMKALSLRAYHLLAAYDVAACYRLTAISKAAGILRNYRNALKKNSEAKKPYVKRRMFVDCYSFKIEGGTLRLTIRAGEYEFLSLNKHTQQALSQGGVRSVTLTEDSLSISYRRDTIEIRPKGVMGIDRNLDNVTVASSNDAIKTFDLSKATQAKDRARQTKRKFKRNDARIRRAIFGKYGEIQRNRVNWVLHYVSAKIVKEALQRKCAIVMENLKGIRKLYRKGNGQGKDYRARLNSWSYAELQRQIEYKARWEGIPVYYVDPRGTSAKCATCGSKTYPNADRTLYCPECKTLTDRDANAARNILAKGALRFGADGPAGEAMVQEPRREEVILKVDAGKLSEGADMADASASRV